MEPVGYAYLIERFRLPALPLPVTRVVTGALRGRRLRDQGGRLLEEFGRSYGPEPTAIGHLRFALSYEGVNLEVLSLLFDRTRGEEIRVALLAQPTSTAPRRLAHLFEWLTGRSLELPADALPRKLRYVPV